MAVPGILAIGLALAVLVYGYAVTRPVPPCTGCGEPLTGGFDARDFEGVYCRTCARIRGLKPWWDKDSFQ